MVQRDSAAGVAIRLGLEIAGVVIAGYILGYAFTKGSQAAGCIQGTCSTPALNGNIL